MELIILNLCLICIGTNIFYKEDCLENSLCLKDVFTFNKIFNLFHSWKWKGKKKDISEDVYLFIVDYICK